MSRPKTNLGSPGAPSPQRLIAMIGAGLSGLSTAFVILLAIVPPLAAEDRPAPARIAVFDFQLIDTSLEGQLTGRNELEAARLRIVSEQLRKAFDASPLYILADIDPVRDRANRQRMQHCGGCDRKLASEVGAELAVTGTVQKVSNLILNINVYVREVASGKLVRVASADIRGNTDESWRRGVQWLIKNRLELRGGDAPEDPRSGNPSGASATKARPGN